METSFLYGAATSAHQVEGPAVEVRSSVTLGYLLVVYFVLDLAFFVSTSNRLARLTARSNYAAWLRFLLVKCYG